MQNQGPTNDHVVLGDPIAYYGGQMGPGQNFTPWSDSMQQDGGTDQLSGGLLQALSSAEQSGVGSAAATAPAYNFDGSNTSTTSSGGSGTIVWLMLVVVAGAGALWFFMRKKKSAPKAADD